MPCEETILPRGWTLRSRDLVGTRFCKLHRRSHFPEETAVRIAVMGSGGIGGYLGARLAQAGEDVIFIARGSHLEAMQQKGLRVESPLGEIVLRHVNATETPADVGFVDIVVFAVKAYDTESAAAAIVSLVGPATRVVTLQNGVDSVDAVAQIVPRSQVVGGTTYLAALIERPGVIVHLGSVTRVIVGGRDDAMIETWRSACVRTGGIDLETVDDIDQMLWTKYVTVSAFSGATSLMRADVGQIFADAQARIFLEQLRDEGMAVPIRRYCGSDAPKTIVNVGVGRRPNRWPSGPESEPYECLESELSFLNSTQGRQVLAQSGQKTEAYVKRSFRCAGISRFKFLHRADLVDSR
jgi:2-dehydropantoate 2-reductase